MNIRNMKADDVDKFVFLYVEAYKGLEQYAYRKESNIRRYFWWLFSRDPEGFFIMEAAKRPIGIVACDANWLSAFEGDLVGEIHEIFVHPDYGRSGVGRTLMEKAIEYAKSKGRKIAGLWVGADNMGAKEFYRKLGFCEKFTLGKWTRMIKEI